MTTPIHSATALLSIRQLQVSTGEGQLAVLEAPALDPETRSRLLQLRQVLRSAGAAAARQIMLTEQLKEGGLGTMGPPSTEVLSDPAAMEELKQRKHKESQLVAALREALHVSTRTQDDLLRAISFLMPQIIVEDDGSVGLPGFQGSIDSPNVDAGGLIWNSHADFFAQISALLEVLKTEWLSKYQESLAKFLEFYKEFSDIMEDLRPIASGDKGDVAINFYKTHGLLKDLMERYGMDDNALASFSSESAAEAFRDSLGLPGLKITGPGDDGLFYVKMDVSAVVDLMESMEFSIGGGPVDGEVIMDSAQYNAWVSAKDSNMEQIKHVSKVLGEKLNEMTQKYDNIVKILSSSIDKMSEANNAYVHNT